HPFRLWLFSFLLDHFADGLTWINELMTVFEAFG
ncbi:MAG: hypothetical protein ACI83L_002808, partial [Cryomorphaceae bacterium]